MSDYLNHLVMRSIGQTMDIKPRPVSMFESRAISLDQSPSLAFDGDTPFVGQVKSLPRKHSTAPSPNSFEEAEPDSWDDLPSSGSIESHVSPLNNSAVQEYPSAYRRPSSTEVAPLKTDLSLPKMDESFLDLPRHTQGIAKKESQILLPTPWARNPYQSNLLEQPIFDFNSSKPRKKYPKQIGITPQSPPKVFYSEAGGSHHMLLESSKSNPLEERRYVSQQLMITDDIELSHSSGRHDMSTDQEAHSLNSVIFQPPLARRVLPTTAMQGEVSSPISKPSPTIQVTIGRIEVRGNPQVPNSTPKPRQNSTISLDDYLSKRLGGSRT
jgi:hypothetical protein